jgi:V/A-type H+/Na+-transporting ATPase subunit G/H
VQSAIIKESVATDKKYREAIEKLESQKEHIEDTVLAERKKLIQAHQKELKSTLHEMSLNHIRQYELNLEKERLIFEDTLLHLKTLYKENKNAWIQSIFKACIMPVEGEME